MTLNNRITRILVSALAIPIILGIAYLGKIPFLIFSLVIGTASYYEFSSMVKSKDHQTNKFLGLLFITILILNAYFNIIEMGMLFLIIVLTLMLYELFRNRSSAINNLGSTLIGIVYIGLFTSALVKVREFYSDSDLLYSQGGLIIISVLLTIWVCDSAAYFLGSA
ncbi:MAG: phosphatidate cytidylyltransferase, partial [Melioribacteraceae bacterium]|nr:phosphatidate cytidylyltransferase [Melioribacteraceae bacterium]